MVLTYSGLSHLALCCLQTNVQPHWLVTSTLQCIPWHHKMSGYEGMINDSVLVSGKPPFQQHWNDTSKHNPFSVLLNFVCLKQWLMCMFICTFTNLNTNACDQKKFMFKIFLSYLQLLIMDTIFVYMTCISHCQICFRKGCFSCY